MKKYSTFLTCFIFLFFFLNFLPGKANAQCFSGNTKGFITLDSLSDVKDFVEDDFTGDGVPDLAVENYNGSTIEILKNDGGGNFSPDTSFNITYADGIIEADWNGDGKPDLLIPRYYERGVRLTNKGNGKFRLSAGVYYFASDYTDVNNDVKDDAIQFVSPSSFYVTLNLGHDSFASPVYYNLPFLVNKISGIIGSYDSSYCIAISDVNGDKFKDILFCTQSNDSGYIKLYFNDNAGNFIYSKNIFVPFIPLNIQVADMNGDSLADILVADPNDSLHILLQDSTNNFHESCTVAAMPYKYFYQMTTRDLNGDGSTDILALLNNGDPEVYFGNGHGQIDSSKHYIIRSGVAPSFKLTAKDLNGDGSPDIALKNNDVPVNEPGNRIVVMLNDGKGNFGYPYMYDTDSTACCEGGYAHISTCDATGKGTSDMILSNSSTDGFKILTYRGNQNFKEDTIFFPGQPFPGRADFVNLNNDSLPDIAYDVEGQPNKLIFLINQGNFHFSKADSIPFSSDRFVSGNDKYAFGDLNNDGIPDLALVSNDTVAIYLNDGKGKFALLQYILRHTNQTTIIRIADLDKDGYNDIVAGNGFDQYMTVFKNNGEDSFSASETPLPRSYDPSGALFADVNGDGFPDIVISEYPILIFLNDGTGNFPKYLIGPSISANIYISDMNEDGRPDLVFSSPYELKGGVMFNNGDGIFGNPVFFDTEFYPADMAAFDLTGDRRNDLIMTSSYNNSLQFLINCDTGTFTSVPNQKVEMNNVLTVFPNPSTGHFTVSLKAEGLNKANSRLTIINIYGQKIYQQKLIVNQNSSMQNVSPTDWANGVYFIMIESGNRNWETKFIKQ